MKILLILFFLVFSFSAQAESWKQIKCMALNVYWEAGNQSTEGQFAVANVTLNRVRSKYYPNTICKVVWQKKWSPTYHRMVPQFSWTLDGKSDKPDLTNVLEQAAWESAVIIAARAINNYDNIDKTHGSTNYHADYVDPNWANNKRMKYIATIGTHIFYKEHR